MGLYVNPPMRVKEIGRPVIFGDFHRMCTQLLPGEILVGLYDRLVFKLAPVIPNADELELFERQYREGQLVSHDFYAVKQEDL